MRSEPCLLRAQVASGRDSVTDIYSTGKSMFFAMIMVVTLEIGLLARYWTTPFVIICFLSYVLVGPGLGTWQCVFSRHAADACPRLWLEAQRNSGSADLPHELTS
jgi:hypothetical protein